MAGINRVINSCFWNDQFTRTLTPEEKLVFLHYLTNSHTTICGVYEMPKALVSFESGIDDKHVTSFLEKAETAGKLRYNKEYGVVYISNYMKYQTGNRPSYLSNANKQLNELSFPVQEWLTDIGAFSELLDLTGVDFVHVNTEIRELLNLFGSLWQNKYNKPFPVDWTKGQKSLRSILKIYKKAQIEEYMKLFFESEDKFIKDNGHSFLIFPATLPKLIVKKVREEVNEENRQFIESTKAEVAELIKPKRKTGKNNVPGM